MNLAFTIRKLKDFLYVINICGVLTEENIDGRVRQNSLPLWIIRKFLEVLRRDQQRPVPFPDSASRVFKELCGELAAGHFLLDQHPRLIANDTHLDRGEFIHHGQKKVMPTLSDFHERLVEASKQTGNECLVPVANSLQMFVRNGVYGLFDTQTSPELA